MLRIILNSLDFPESVILSESDGSRSDARFTPQAVITTEKVALGFRDVSEAANYLKSTGDSTVRYISGKGLCYLIPAGWVGDGESISDRVTGMKSVAHTDPTRSETLRKIRS